MRIKNEKTAGKIPCRIHLPVAQLDNATDSDSGEWGFKSLRAGQKRTPYGVSFLVCPKGFEADRKENAHVGHF